MRAAGRVSESAVRDVPGNTEKVRSSELNPASASGEPRTPGSHGCAAAKEAYMMCSDSYVPPAPLLRHERAPRAGKRVGQILGLCVLLLGQPVGAVTYTLTDLNPLGPVLGTHPTAI